MEQNPFLRPEDDDDSDKDKDDSSKKKKKSIVFPRRVPGVSVDKQTGLLPDRKEQKVARIIDSLFIEKPKKTEETDKQAETDEPDSAEQDQAAGDVETSVESDADDELVIHSEAADSADIIETEASTDWQQEGYLDEDAEISLQNPPREVEAHAEAAEHVEEAPLVTGEVVSSSPVSVEEDVDEEAPETAAAGGGEAPPPESPEDLPDDGPEIGPIPLVEAGYDEPSYYARREAERLRGVDTDERAREEELNDAEYRGEKRGQQHGVVAGLAAGWYFFGHRGKKKMAKNYEKAIRSKDREIDSLQSEQFAAKDRLQVIQRNQETIQSAIALKELKPAAAPVEGLGRHSQESIPLAALGAETNKAEKQHSIARSETGTTTHAAEKGPQSEQFERERRKHELPEDQEITEETYQTAEGSRVEASSWHRIEIDAKTGKPVENPEVEYGEEFRRETRKEILRNRGNQDNPAAVQLGSMATTASLSTDSHAQDSSVATPLQASSIGSQADSQQVIADSPKTSAPQGRPLARDPIIWAAGIALVVILFILASLL